MAREFDTIYKIEFNIQEDHFIDANKMVFASYSTVTDFAKFLGLSTSKPFSFAM